MEKSAKHKLRVQYSNAKGCKNVLYCVYVCDVWCVSLDLANARFRFNRIFINHSLCAWPNWYGKQKPKSTTLNQCNGIIEKICMTILCSRKHCEIDSIFSRPSINFPYETAITCLSNRRQSGPKKNKKLFSQSVLNFEKLYIFCTIYASVKV